MVSLRETGNGKKFKRNISVQFFVYQGRWLFAIAQRTTVVQRSAISQNAPSAAALKARAPREREEKVRGLI